jgi:hypothetical protein
MGGVIVLIISVVSTIGLLLYTRTNHYDKVIDKMVKREVLKYLKEKKRKEQLYVNEKAYDFRKRLNEQVDEIIKGDNK